MTADRKDEILAFAEREMRKGGFGAVSYRDIAAAVGIKSASVHYHFPTKADLGSAVIERYADNFLIALGSPGGSAKDRTKNLARLSDAYISAYRQDSSNCLCAVLGAACAELPEKTVVQIAVFYERLTEWIDNALGPLADDLSAGVVISLLQGAMTLATVTGSETPLKEAKRHLVLVLSNSRLGAS